MRQTREIHIKRGVFLLISFRKLVCHSVLPTEARRFSPPEHESRSVWIRLESNGWISSSAGKGSKISILAVSLSLFLPGRSLSSDTPSIGNQI